MEQYEGQSIVVRDVHFQLEAEDCDIPVNWHGAGLGVSRFFDALSLLFPAGERFFIASVKNYAETVKSNALQRAVRDFCAQEGVHAREHAHYNRLLARWGYAAEPLDQRTADRMRWVSRVFSPERRLAITCALEHFTAVFAHILLSQPGLLEAADPRMAALWRWHALEESEHKAVAFDVYRNAGCSNAVRVFTMVTTTWVFLGEILHFYFRLAPHESFWTRLRYYAQSQVFLFRYTPWRELLRQYGAYYRADFHPWQHDNRELMDHWSRALADRPYA
jgi:predicted metal-dependent hydrolase